MRVQAQIPPGGCKIMLVGEAPGEQEDLVGVPFFGPAGQELTRMLGEAGIERSQCAITNVFDIRPANNDLKNWAMGKKDWTAKCRGLGVTIPVFGTGLSLDPDIVVPAMDRLQSEIAAARPNIIVALGNTALVALTGHGGIGRRRGVVSQLPNGPKLLATYHPSAILRDWSLRTIAVADLGKAQRESSHADIRMRERTIYIPETVEDVLSFELASGTFTFDVETSHGQITCISIAPNPDYAICIPLWDKSKADWSYWSEGDELIIMQWLTDLLASPLRKRAQNGLYDLQYCLAYGMPVVNYSDDTMILHHCLFSEMPKSLGFLASIYINEIDWKALNPRGRDKLKREE